MSHSGQLANDEAAHAAALLAELLHALIKTQPLILSKLPTAALAGKGARACITDATLTFASANFGATAVGGGANFVPVVSDGTNWKIG
jgi:hypothetical protein